MAKAKKRYQWIDKILKTIKKTDNECWVYTGFINKNGYGQVTISEAGGSKHLTTHRLIYSALVGPIPPGLYVCHSCNEKKCCNPKHLFAITRAKRQDLTAKQGRTARTYGEKAHNTKYSAKIIQFVKAHPGPYPVIMNETGISKSQISNIKNGKSRKYG